MAETKYNLLTRLLKDLRNQVSSSGDIGGNSDGGVLVVHNVTSTLLNGVLPNIDGYEFTQGTLEDPVSRLSFSLDIGELSLTDIVVSINGEKVDSDLLNYENGKLEISTSSEASESNIESNITGLTITVTSKDRLDHTYAEIKAAPLSVIRASDGNEAFVFFAKEFYYDNGLFFIKSGNGYYACETEADYPYLYEISEVSEGSAGREK